MGILESSYIQAPPDTADKITEKLKSNLFEDAYQLLKTDVEKNTRDLDAQGKQDYYKSLLDEIETRQKGGTTQLSSVWLKHLIEDNGQENIKISKTVLSDVSEKSWSPLNRGMARAVLGDFEIVDDLKSKDGVLDKDEANRYVRRQSLTGRDQFTSGLVNELKAQMKESPAQAVEKLIARTSERAQAETSAEDAQTWQAVADAMKSNDLVSKLSMSWLARIKPLSSDGSYTLSQVESLSRSLVNPIHKQFAEYIVANWKSIATVDYPAETIQPREMAVYERKQMQK